MVSLNLQRKPESNKDIFSYKVRYAFWIFGESPKLVSGNSTLVQKKMPIEKIEK